MKAIIPEHDDSFAGQPCCRRVTKAHKGRGAVSNLQGRYEAHARAGFDDGWSVGGLDAAEGEAAPELENAGQRRAGAHHPHAQCFARFALQCVAESVPGVRTRLHLLLCRPTHSYLGLSPVWESGSSDSRRNSISLGYRKSSQKWNLGLNLSGDFTKNNIENIRRVDASGVRISTYENTRKKQPI